MKAKIRRNSVYISHIISIIIFIVILTAAIYNIVKDSAGINTNTITYVLLHSLIFILFVVFITFYFHSYKRTVNYAKRLADFQKKFEFITTTSNIIVMQYDVTKREFTRCNLTNDEPFRIFKVKELWSHIHFNHLHIAHNLVDFMDKQIDRHYSCEYKYLLPGNKKHNWIYIDAYPYEHNKDGAVISYIGICRNNDKWHIIKNKLERFRLNVSLITSSNGISFGQYDVATDTLYSLDDSGELAENVIPIESFWKSVHPEDIDKAKKLIAILREHQLTTFQTEFRIRNSKENTYDWSIVNIAACERDQYNRTSRYICLRRNNNIWREAMNEMIDLRNRAESANKMKNAFLANMSHEIRTPLNAVVGFSSIINDDMSKEDRNKFKEIIAQNNRMIMQIVDDVLTLSKIESGDLEFDYSNFDICDFIHSVVDSMRIFIKKGVEISCDTNDHFDVRLDSRRMTEVMTTLLTNANKFTAKGNIRIIYKQKDNGIYVAISDTGIGIAPKDQRRIFERFEKVNNFISGTGLGLPICKGIIEQAKGKIGVESELGKGSTFWFWVPCDKNK